MPVAAILCPLCRTPLTRGAKVWSCERGHSFDVAREGYVNLLPVQHKNSRDPGDSADALIARREFLQAGHYQPLREAVVASLAPLGAQSVIDVGCGEGYYTSAFVAAVPDVIGLDIAKPAIQLAARRFRDITWLVGSAALLPVADASMDVVSSLFCPLHIAEMYRALRPGGHALVVTPAPAPLWSVRAGLFDEVRAHEPDKFVEGFEAQFEYCGRQDLSCALKLTQQTLKQLLLMTPYVWKARPEKRAALETHATFETQAAFSLLLFRKKPTLSS